MGIKKGEEYFLEKFNTIHNGKYKYPNFKYNSNRDIIDIECPVHGIFKQSINNHSVGKGCNKCGRDKTGLAKRSKLEDLLISFKEKHGDNYGYDRFTEFKPSHEKIDIFCKKHQEYFSQSINSHKKGTGCPKCGREKAELAKYCTQEKFLEQVIKKHGDLYDLSLVEYKDSKTKVKIICRFHGIFEIQPGNFKQGKGCLKCANDVRRSNTKTFVGKSIIKHGYNYDYSKVEYYNTVTPVTIICKHHGEFQQIPNGHLNGNGCKTCIHTVSKAETELATILKEHFTDLEQSNKKILNGLELDIFIPSKNLAIEYHGLYWHSDKFKQPNDHLIKLNKCQEKEIRLIQIFEDEWLNKKDIVLSRLFSLLGISKEKIYAKNCEIREVNSKESGKFLTENHIQGKLGASHRIGLYYNNELVSLMTFGGLRKNLGTESKEGSFELLRFCNKLNTNVIGGASKLQKYFENKYKPNEIISYADLRWSDGNLYKKLNYELVSQSEPNYFYTKGTERENRFKYRKSELVKEGFDKNKTEKQIMIERGFSRIYDAGTLKFKTKK